MPFPRIVAKTNRYWTNPVARRLAGRFPPFILIRHIGRRSGRRYETPVWAFRQPDGFLIVLTYGPGAEWVRNLFTAGSCDGVYGGVTYALTEARIVESDPRSQPLPWFVQWAVGLIGVRHFLYVTARNPNEE
ncbi:MAG: nitroreductase family deazaflavin-dependent oxidoreductase [Chloroflexia bacterium]|nr:nitroreductase family deazaflavin-dependent oxidoreductase [Chloroflexia bacterium]